MKSSETFPSLCSNSILIRCNITVGEIQERRCVAAWLCSRERSDRPKEIPRHTPIYPVLEPGDMNDIPLDPAAAEQALPETYAETMNAFFTDLADQESDDYMTNVKRVLALDYVLLRADIDEHDKTEQARLDLTYTIEAVDLKGMTIQNVSGSDKRQIPYAAVREEFEFTPLEATKICSARISSRTIGVIDQFEPREVSNSFNSQNNNNPV